MLINSLRLLGCDSTGFLKPTRILLGSIRLPAVSPNATASSSLETNVKKTVPSSKFTGFSPVFISPHIRLIQVACRLKLYQSGLVLMCLPISVYLLKTDQVLPHHVGFAAGFSVVTLAVLGLVGEFFRKFVGILYLSDDKSEVIISHNTFFGRRHDVRIEVENILPLADTPETVEELLWKIQLYKGHPKNFYICTRFGGIISLKDFRVIFGEDDFKK